MTETHSRQPDGDLAGLDISLASRFQAGIHWPLFTRLRREAPVHFCPASPYGPYWSITRYDDIVEVEKNHDGFSSDGNIIIGDVPQKFDCTRAFATSDPPVHTRERKAVVPAVSTARMVELEHDTRSMIAALLDRLPYNETFDWVQRVSVEITAHMAAVLFGFPATERHLLTYWSEVLVTTPGPAAVVHSWEERDAVIGEYRNRLLSMWRERATCGQGMDILSLLAHNSGTTGMVEDPMHLVGTVSLIAGANEAARGALSGCVVAFNRFPQEWEKLRHNPQLLDNAVDEIVRWQTPIIHMRRTATRNIEFRGEQIRTGDRVVMWYCSGNRDEAYFPQADTLLIDRPNARNHLSYGYGIHRCLGQHVARMELRILLQEMVARFDRVELVGEPVRLASNFSANYSHLLVRIG